LTIPALQIAEALAPFALDVADATLEQFAAYLRLVQQYSQGFNLTGFSSESELAFELIVESARLLELGPIGDGWRVVDLGSGAGAPVVTLAVLCPLAQFSAVEPSERRSAFLRQVQASLKLENLEICAVGAAEVSRSYRRACDLVTSRAFTPLPRLLPLVAKFLRPGGQLRGYLGAIGGGLDAVAARSGFHVAQIVSYQVGDAQRHIYRLDAESKSAS